MEETEYKWLLHLEGAVPKSGQGKRISTYTVALEGWRRGLDLKFYSVFEDGYKLKVRYSLSSKHKTHHFSLSMGDNVTDRAFDICDDKDLTKQYLAEKDVPVPNGAVFGRESTEEEIINFALTLGFPLVIKPTDGNAGNGVFANIQEEDNLQEIIHYIRNDLGFSHIIVEKYVSGDEFRIFVIEDKVLGAMNRKPAHVIGDGIHTIRQLIHQKNKQRRINPHLTSRLIKIDKEITDLLARSDHKLSTIPANEEMIYLREKSNLSTGGESEDVTDELTPELEKIAIDVGKAIPGLPHYGVDMIVSDDRQEGVILEVNSRPGIGGHLFPGKGEPRDLARDIIDYYFPETKDGDRTDLFFDFDNILEPITKRAASNVDVINPPLGKLYGKKFIVTGEFNKGNYRRYVRRQAIKRNMHGYTERTVDNQIIVVIMSTDEVEVIQFKDVCLEGPKGIEVEDIEDIEEHIWNKPVKLSFETKADYKLTDREIRNLVTNQDVLQSDIERINKQYSQVIESNAWRATYPIRALLHGIKKFFRTITGRR